MLRLTSARKMIFCSWLMTIDTQETQFWPPAISQFQFVRTVCPLSLDIVRRLKHHDFSQSWFQLAYSRLYDYNIAEVHKPIVVVAGLQASACYYSHTCPARAACSTPRLNFINLLRSPGCRHPQLLSGQVNCLK